jgi:N-acetylmuramic acid-specific PTS system IIC component
LVTLGNDGTPSGIGTAHGSIFGIILGCTVAIYLEKHITKVMPIQLDTVFTPFLVALFMVFINIFLIIPVSGYLFFAMT